MSKHDEIVAIAILPAGGRAKQLVGRVFRKRRARVRVHDLCDFEEARVPSLVLIDTPALSEGESALVKVIAKIRQSAWRDVPIVILDAPNADLMRGFAAGYVARIRLDSPPEIIAQLIDKVLHTAV
jgi:CheY-like chemotaxis protein